MLFQQPENDDSPPSGKTGAAEEEEEEEEGQRENGGVPAWSASFERLLEDPAGLHTFAVSNRSNLVFKIKTLLSI